MADGKQKGLTPGDVCAIIKACGESQVRVLKFAGLHLEFEPKGSAEQAISVVPAERTPEPPAEAPAETQLQAEAERSLVQDELAYREDEIAQMLIENPMRAEQLLTDGGLEADGSDDDEEA
jgi:hypothetical protein